MDGLRAKAMTSRALRTKKGRKYWRQQFTQAAKKGNQEDLVELVGEVFQRLPWRVMRCDPGSNVAAELLEAIRSIRSARDAIETMKNIATSIIPKFWKRGAGDIAGASGAAGGEASSAEEGQE
eukprot:1811306-Rhodomonas_salina.1